MRDIIAGLRSVNLTANNVVLTEQTCSYVFLPSYYGPLSLA